jgi:hypothetical protein
VAINVETRLSPGWWMDRLFRRLSDQKRYTRLQELHDRYHGDPPLPEGADAARELFTAFQKKSRTNYSELAVSAVSERMKPVGFRTAVDSDETGDGDAIDAWDRARMAIVAADAHDLMLNLGEAYVIVGFTDERTGVPVVTAEDPRWTVGEPDPVNPYTLRAALKFLRDDIEGEDRAYLCTCPARSGWPGGTRRTRCGATRWARCTGARRPGAGCRSAAAAWATTS